MTPSAPLRLDERRGRLVLLATVLGSGMAMLDATVVNVALPRIGQDFDAGLASLQWTVTAYTLTLAALLLLGGSLGDRFGRRRVYVVGIAWFALASLLCGIAPNAEMLIAARALQGVGGALLTPGSLAILEASFEREHRARAIGAWSGLSGVTTAVGPFVGGWLIDAASWRWIFLLNLPLAAAVVWLCARYVPESADAGSAGRPIDVTGAVLVAVGLAGVTYALVEGPGRGWGSAGVVAATVIGLTTLVAFVAVEVRGRHPMLPVGIFADRVFTATNAVTFLVYGALSAAFFLLPLQLQQVLGYSALEAGTALLPPTILLLLLSARAGALGTRIGPRIPMSVGPLVAAVGFLLFLRVDAGASYVGAVLPALVVFGLGLSLTVAPLTATALASAPTEHAGMASAVNNTVARTAGLLAVAVVPVVAGLSGDVYLRPDAFTEGYRVGVTLAAAVCAAGGVLAWVTLAGTRPVAAPRDERVVEAAQQ